MKRVAIAVAVLLLAGCSSPSEKVAGQVVSCESISSSTTDNSVVLDCLDGGIGEMDVAKAKLLVKTDKDFR